MPVGASLELTTHSEQGVLPEWDANQLKGNGQIPGKPAWENESRKTGEVPGLDDSLKAGSSAGRRRCAWSVQPFGNWSRHTGSPGCEQDIDFTVKLPEGILNLAPDSHGSQVVFGFDVAGGFQPGDLQLVTEFV